MDTVTRLRNVPLFAALALDHLARLAQIVTRRSYAQGTLLSKQGESGETLYIIDAGRVVLHQTGLPARPQGTSYLGEGDLIGEDALLLGDPHCFSAQAVTDVEVLAIGRHDFSQLLKQYPQIEQQLKPSPLIRERLQAPTFPWQDKDEPTLLLRKRHWFAFVRNLPIPLLILLGLSVAAWLLRQVNILTSPLVTALFVFTIPTLIVLWFYVDWQNDFYLITTKRILHEERVFALYQTWEEAGLDKVTDTVVMRGFLGKMLGFGTLQVQTASLRGAMVLDHLPDPESVQEVICKQTGQLGSVMGHGEREDIRNRLQRQLAKMGTEEGEALIPALPLPEQLEPRVGAITRLLQLRSREDDQVIWRKHWVFLIRQGLLPLIALLATTALIAISLLGLPARYGILLFVISLVLWIASLVWLWWRVEDWGNDLYIVTDQLIIDIEKKPLFFSEARRQATLDMIQNVSLRKEGLLPALLNYGDVLIQTAGVVGEFTFAGVGDPMHVQREIFRRVDNFNQQRQRRETERDRDELSRWFREYHEMLQNPEAPDS